jgi:uncharacterized caspase-like protein
VTRPQRATPPGGVAALFSCSPGEKAFEHPDLGHGVFFHFVIEGLKGKAADAEGQVTMPDLEKYLQREVYNFVRARIGEEQTPNRIGSTNGLVPIATTRK